MTDKEKQKLMDYKNTFLSETGRRVLDDLEDVTFYFKKNTVPYVVDCRYLDNTGKIDINKVMRFEALRSLMFYIHDKINKVPKE